MTLIKLTRPDGKDLYVNPDQVCCVEYSTSQFATEFTMVTFVTGQFRPVAETVYEVVAMLRRQGNEA
jgi:uncharacterized protein YlzI (FlbEa/FlbD family)